MRHPQVFLFDEPLSNLDAKLRVQMRVELKKLHERLGTTAIYVTHDQVEAMTLGDRVVVMRDGLVQQVGDPMELYNAPANRFVAGFIGSPAMNFAGVRIAAENGGLWAQSEGIRIKVPAPMTDRLGPYAGKEVTLGVRPEDLHIAAAGDPGDLCIDAEVEVVERLGSEILLDVAVGPDTMVASVDPTVDAPRCMKSCGWRSTPNACISSTTRPKRRFSSRPRSGQITGTTIRGRQHRPTHQGRKRMTQIHRRRVLQLSGASAAAAATGGLAGILASGRAPAYGQTQTVHWLRWSDFVPASDVLSQRARSPSNARRISASS